MYIYIHIYIYIYRSPVAQKKSLFSRFLCANPFAQRTLHDAPWDKVASESGINRTHQNFGGPSVSSHVWKRKRPCSNACSGVSGIAPTAPSSPVRIQPWYEFPPFKKRFATITNLRPGAPAEALLALAQSAMLLNAATRKNRTGRTVKLPWARTRHAHCELAFPAERKKKKASGTSRWIPKC